MGTPCIVLREETEWRELIEARWNKLVPPQNSDLLYRESLHLLQQHKETETSPYGKGDAAVKIAKIVYKYLSEFVHF